MKVLSGRRFNLAELGILQSHLDIRRAVDRRNKDILATGLLRGQRRPDGLRVVNGKDRVDVRESRQVALGDVETAIPRALPVLVFGKDFYLRIFGQHLLDAGNSIDNRRDLGTIFNDHAAFSLEPAGDVLSGDAPGLNVFRRNTRVSPIRYSIDAYYETSARPY